MVLCGVQIHGMNTSRALEEIREDVVASGSDSKDLIISTQLQEALVDTGVFPCESIDVLILELSMLRKLLIVVDAPVVVLVEE